MAEKLKRHLDKVYQYASGISHLIQKAKRPFPIPLGYGHFHREEGEIDLADNPYDAVSRGLGRPSLPSEIVDDPVCVRLRMLTSAYPKVILKTSFFV